MKELDPVKFAWLATTVCVAMICLSGTICSIYATFKDPKRHREVVEEDEE
jgi:aerobic-type carbon monoxide dehydrogenase small subunit (CoxS/CutS family)